MSVVNMDRTTVRFAGRAIRVLLSFMVVAGLLAVVYLAAVARAMMERSSDSARANVTIAGNSQPDASAEAEVPWPRFPGCQVSAPSAMTINGVLTIGEVWETTASAAEILDFLRDQMEARGWVDCTEETYGLNPEFRSHGDGRKGLLNEDYVKVYAATIDSCLVLRDRSRFMQVSLEPGAERGRISVSLFAAETSSYEAFSQGLALSLGGVPTCGGRDNVAEFSEKGRGHTYSTRLVNSRQDRVTAASEMIEALKAENWQAVVVSLSQTGEQGSSLALFQRGNEYAYLTVTEAEDGKGSCSLLTEATEDQNK